MKPVEYTVEEKEGIITLLVNGAPAACRVGNAVPIQNNFGGVGFINQPCNSQCTAFDAHYQNSQREKHVYLHCIKRTIKAKEAETKPQSNLLVN